MWRRWTQEVVGRDGAAQHYELDHHEEDSDAHGGASAAGGTNWRQSGRSCRRSNGTERRR